MNPKGEKARAGAMPNGNIFVLWDRYVDENTIDPRKWNR